MTPSPYVSAAETEALLAASQRFRAARLAASDMVTIEQAAQLANADPFTIELWASTGRALGLSLKEGCLKLPRWQFEPVMRQAIPRLTSALGTKEGWALLSFLESPNSALAGLTPRAAIEQGDIERVVVVARSADDASG